MGEPLTGWQVNITFDRRLVYSGIDVDETGVDFRCIDLLRFVPGARVRGHSEVFFDIPRSRMELAENVLAINMKGMPNERIRDCYLRISNEAFVDQDFVPFAGIQDGDYAVTLRDIVPPR